jgi:hypothetical protein
VPVLCFTLVVSVVVMLFDLNERLSFPQNKKEKRKKKRKEHK